MSVLPIPARLQRRLPLHLPLSPPLIRTSWTHSLFSPLSLPLLPLPLPLSPLIRPLLPPSPIFLSPTSSSSLRFTSPRLSNSAPTRSLPQSLSRTSRLPTPFSSSSTRRRGLLATTSPSPTTPAPFFLPPLLPDGRTPSAPSSAATATFGRRRSTFPTVHLPSSRWRKRRCAAPESSLVLPMYSVERRPVVLQRQFLTTPPLLFHLSPYSDEAFS